MQRPLLLSFATLLFAGCAHWNTVTRLPKEKARSPGESALVTSHRPSKYRNYGCSFIEFDGRGGFLEYGQFVGARAELARLKAQSNVLLVLYCHGWQNNAQSADVGRFTSFLRQLADSPAIRHKGMRVHGVYLGWRGSSFFPVAAFNEPNIHLKEVIRDLGGAPTNPRWQTPEALGPVIALPKVLTYWWIKPRAEFYSSRVPLARAVFSLAFELKSPGEAARGRNHEVFVIGHSFGALMLEQAIGQASVGLLASEWNRGASEARWPFDLIVFLNSAAPSLYAKQFGEFLEEDHRNSAQPRIVSLTSTGDQATGTLHRIGNLFSTSAPDLQRRYHPWPGVEVTAGYYYDRTPGHNQYLINHEVIPASSQAPAPPPNDDAIFQYNLRMNDPHPEEFYTRVGNDVRRWKLKDLSGSERNPQTRQIMKRYASNYWIATVPPEIIKDHGDIWSPACVEMLAGVYRMAHQLEGRPALVRTGPDTGSECRN